jgi:Family of unknown function (DUF6636)
VRPALVVVAALGLAAPVAAALAMAVRPACAAPNPFFRTPSKNIYCAYFGSLRCDIRSGLKPKPARPVGCGFDWGQTFVLSRSGRARVGCVSDSVFDPSARVLPYGAKWRRGGITCASKRTGLLCFNPSSHGVFMSRDRSYRF